jgi:hypothetical protein
VLLWSVPTAKQVTVFVHDTPFNDTPDGKLPVGVDQFVRFVVAKEPAPPELEVPTARQFVGPVHDIDLRLIAGRLLRKVQLVPS